MLDLPKNKMLRCYNLFPQQFGNIDNWTKYLNEIQDMDFNTVWVNPFTQSGKAQMSKACPLTGIKQSVKSSLYAAYSFFDVDERFSVVQREGLKLKFSVEQIEALEKIDPQDRKKYFNNMDDLFLFYKNIDDKMLEAQDLEHRFFKLTDTQKELKILESKLKQTMDRRVNELKSDIQFETLFKEMNKKTLKALLEQILSSPPVNDALIGVYKNLTTVLQQLMEIEASDVQNNERLQKMFTAFNLTGNDKLIEKISNANLVNPKERSVILKDVLRHVLSSMNQPIVNIVDLEFKDKTENLQSKLNYTNLDLQKCKQVYANLFEEITNDNQRFTRFLNDKALIRFTETAKKFGMNPIFDLVLNHVSNDHPLIHQKPEWFSEDQTYLDATGFIYGLLIQPTLMEKEELLNKAKDLNFEDRKKILDFTALDAKISKEQQLWLTNKLDQLSFHLDDEDTYIAKYKLSQKHLNPKLYDTIKHKIVPETIEFWKQVIDHMVDLGFCGSRVDCVRKVPQELRKPLYDYLKEKIKKTSPLMDPVILEEALFSTMPPKMFAETLGITGATHITGSSFYSKRHWHGGLEPFYAKEDGYKQKIVDVGVINFTGNHDHHSAGMHALRHLALERLQENSKKYVLDGKKPELKDDHTLFMAMIKKSLWPKLNTLTPEDFPELSEELKNFQRELRKENATPLLATHYETLMQKIATQAANYVTHKNESDKKGYDLFFTLHDPKDVSEQLMSLMIFPKVQEIRQEIKEMKMSTLEHLVTTLTDGIVTNALAGSGGYYLLSGDEIGAVNQPSVFLRSNGLPIHTPYQLSIFQDKIGFLNDLFDLEVAQKIEEVIQQVIDQEAKNCATNSSLSNTDFENLSKNNQKQLKEVGKFELSHLLSVGFCPELELFVEKLKTAFRKDKDLEFLLEDKKFWKTLLTSKTLRPDYEMEKLTHWDAPKALIHCMNRSKIKELNTIIGKLPAPVNGYWGELFKTRNKDVIIAVRKNGMGFDSPTDIIVYNTNPNVPYTLDKTEMHKIACWFQQRIFSTPKEDSTDYHRSYQCIRGLEGTPQPNVYCAGSIKLNDDLKDENIQVVVKPQEELDVLFDLSFPKTFLPLSKKQSTKEDTTDLSQSPPVYNPKKLDK